MTPFSCARTHELATVLKAGHLPAAWESSLRNHVNECRECSDYLLVSRTLRAARAESLQAAPLSSPSLLWWRAQLRRRHEAFQQISRPTSIIGRLALFSTFLVALVTLFWQRQQSAEWLRWLFGLQDSTHHVALAAQLSIWNVLLGVVALGALAVLGGFALFLASDKT